MVKYLLFFIFIICSTNSFAQILIDSGEVSGYTNAGQGDLYLTSDTNELYIGIESGALRKIANPNEVSTLVDNGDGTITYTNELNEVVTISIVGAQGPEGPPGQDGADGIGVAQTLSQTGTDVTLSDGGGNITVADNDNDSGNEVNTGLDSSENFMTVTDSAGDQTAPIITSNVLFKTGGNNSWTSIVNGVASNPLLLISDDNGNHIVSGSDGGLLYRNFLRVLSNLNNIISISGDGSSGDPFTLFAAEVDGDITNELNTAFSNSVNTLTVTDSAGDLTAPIINTSVLSGSFFNLVSTVNGVSSSSINLISTDPGNRLGAGVDGGLYFKNYLQPSSNANNIITITGDGTSGDPFAISAAEVDGDITNELQDLSLVGNILTLSDPATALNQVDLSGVNTDLALNNQAKINIIEPIITDHVADDQDTDPENELSDLDLTSNILTLSNPATSGNQVDLSAYVNSDDQNLTTATIDASNVLTINIENGSSVTVDLSQLQDVNPFFVDVAGQDPKEFGRRFTTYIHPTATTDPTNSHDSSTGTIMIPSNGLYQITGTIRTRDFSEKDTQFGVGVHTSNIDGPWFLWHTVQEIGKKNNTKYNRTSYPYIRLARFNAGEQLRMFIYVDGDPLEMQTSGFQVLKISD